MGVILQQSGGGGSSTPSGTQNQVYATPNGSSGNASLRALVAADVPTLNQNTSGTAANLSGTPALPNGTTATTQSPLYASTKVSTTSYVDAAIAAVKALLEPIFTIASAGVGGFFAPWGDYAGVIGANVCSTAASGVVRTIQFTLPYAITFTKATININTTLNSGNFYVGLYDSSKNLLQQFTFALTAATGVYTVSVSAKNLPRGVYWLAWSQDNGTVNALAAGTMSTNGGNVFNKNTVRNGTAGNSESGGTMPASLGTISAVAGQNPLALSLEP